MLKRYVDVFIGKRDTFFLLAIILTTLLAWFKFYDHPIDHESFLYYYFQGKPYGENWMVGEHLFWNYENNFARLLFFILIKIFRDNIYLQVLPFFFLVVLVNVMFYLMVKVLTKNETASFISALFFSVNAAGSFEMYNHGRYFFERVPQFAVVFSSFALFVVFLREKRRILYLFSLSLFLLSLWMAHFSTLFLPAFMIYIFVYVILGWQRQKKDFRWLKTSVLILPFVIGNYLLVKDSPLGPQFFRPEQNLLEFLFTIPSLADQIVFQIVGFTVPKDIMHLLSNTIWRVPMHVVAMRIFWFVLGFYAFSLILLLRRTKEFRLVSSLCILFIAITTIINLYFGRADFSRELSNSSRYFWIPSIFLSIYLGLLLYELIYSKKVIGRIMTVLLISLWILSNTLWIYRWEKDVRWGYTAIAQSIAYIKNLSNDLGNVKYIGVPAHIQRGPLSFLDIYYVKGRAKMVPSEYIVTNIQEFSSNEIVILGYNQNFGQFDKQTFRIVDKTAFILDVIKKQKLNEDKIHKLLYGQFNLESL